MLPRIVCCAKSEVARKTKVVPGAVLIFEDFSTGDMCLVTKQDTKQDPDWGRRCLESGLPIITQANADMVMDGRFVLKMPFDLDTESGLKWAVSQAQQAPMITPAGRFVWPRIPRTANRTLGFKVDGGMGDMFIAMPALRELAKKGFVLYVQQSQTEKCKRVLLLSPDVKGELPSGKAHQELVITYHTRYAPSGDAIIPRQDQYADSCGVACNGDYSVNLRLHDDLCRRYQAWKADIHRPVVAVALNATTRMKSVEPDRAKHIVQILSETCHVAVIHNERTVGDGPNVTDWGGRLNVTELVHLVSVMDGALCVDSGVAHIAGALKIPLVALQGACGIGNHIRYALYGGLVKELCLNLKCSPCWPDFTCQHGREDHYSECLRFDPAMVCCEFKKFIGDKCREAVPKQMPLVFGASGGIGDRIAMLPALQAIEHRPLRLDPQMDKAGHELFAMSPLFKADFGPVAGEVRLRPCDPKQDREADRLLPIQDWHAKCANVTIKDYRVRLTLDEGLLRRYQSWVYSQDRPVIGVSLISAFDVQSRTMPELHRRRLIEALAEKYHIALIHSSPTLGGQTHITDWGGKLSIKELVHFIAALDGMVAVDSGPAHIACITGTPLAALMGIVPPGSRYAKYGGNAVREMYLNLSCAPCWQKGSYGCEKPPKCLEFTPDDILPALQDVCGFMADPKVPYWDWSVVCRYDRPFAEADAKAYMTDLAAIHKAKYDLFRNLGINVRKAAEIGVRGGNGARDMKMVWPNAFYHGFDAENGQAGGGPPVLTTYARSLLRRFWGDSSAISAPVDTQTIPSGNSLPGSPYDVIHVDGNHSQQGVQHDLDIALASLAPGGAIVVDDIDYIPDVKAGAEAWVRAHAAKVTCQYVKTLRGDFVIRRNR